MDLQSLDWIVKRIQDKGLYGEKIWDKGVFDMINLVFLVKQNPGEDVLRVILMYWYYLQF
jgi:hypothetical protein